MIHPTEHLSVIPYFFVIVPLIFVSQRELIPVLYARSSWVPGDMVLSVSSGAPIVEGNPLVWSAMGMYPEISGRAELVLGSPLFSEIRIHGALFI